MHPNGNAPHPRDPTFASGVEEHERGLNNNWPAVIVHAPRSRRCSRIIAAPSGSLARPTPALVSSLCFSVSTICLCLLCLSSTHARTVRTACSRRSGTTGSVYEVASRRPAIVHASSTLARAYYKAQGGCSSQSEGERIVVVAPRSSLSSDRFCRGTQVDATDYLRRPRSLSLSLSVPLSIARTSTDTLLVPP